jgi:hypothetical protein
MADVRKFKARRAERPSLLISLLGKRSKEDRDAIISLLENDKKMRADARERYAAMLLLDFNKMEKDQQDRFAAMMQTGNPDERQRIACVVTRKP